MKKICIFLLLLLSHLYAEDEIAFADQAMPCSSSIAASEDEYLTGYIQALLDIHYCEYGINVEVKNHIAYIYGLPKNELITGSILSFVQDIPCICNVIPVCPKPCCSDPLPPGVCENMLSPFTLAKGVWLPQSTILFAPLVADPRQVTNSAALRFNDRPIGKHVGAVAFGSQFIFYRWRDLWRWHGDLEWGVEAGVFAVFDLDNVDAAHKNTDFFVAALFNYALDRTAFRLRVWHLSSHIGDEFLLSNPHFHRCNLSDEGVDFFISYQLCRPLRLYAGVGDIFARDKTFKEKPIYIEFGTEIRVFGERDCFNKLYVQPFLAMHFRTWQEHNWSLDQTYALGVEWSKIQGIGRKFRIFGEYHDGFSKEGQFLRFRTHYAAIRCEYGF